MTQYASWHATATRRSPTSHLAAVLSAEDVLSPLPLAELDEQHPLTIVHEVDDPVVD